MFGAGFLQKLRYLRTVDNHHILNLKWAHALLVSLYIWCLFATKIKI